MSDWYRWDGDDLLLRVRVQPRASQDAFAEPLGDALKIRITAPPVDGKANHHLVGFMAKTFGVSRNAVSLIAGETSRTKRLNVHKPRRFPEIINPT